MSAIEIGVETDVGPASDGADAISQRLEALLGPGLGERGEDRLDAGIDSGI